MIPVVFPSKSFFDIELPVFEGNVKSGASCPTFGRSAATDDDDDDDNDNDNDDDDDDDDDVVVVVIVIVNDNDDNDDKW